MSWYSQITQDLGVIPDFIKYYEEELILASKDVKIQGNIEKNISSLPGITEHRFNQLQEIEAVLNFLNIQLVKTRSNVIRKYKETYNRELSDRLIEKYTDGDPEVVNYNILNNDVSFLRNRWAGIMKALESKNFMLGHIVRLRTAGMEDITIG
jgi:hypothetical protein